MSAQQLIVDLSWAAYIVIFLITSMQALRHPRRATIDVALFFLVSALVIVIAELGRLGFLKTSDLLPAAMSGTLILLLSYVILRLLDDFAGVPKPWMRLAAGGWVLSSIPLFIWARPAKPPALVTILQIIYFVGPQLYAAIGFVRASRKSSGVTRRRMTAIAAGSVFLGLNVLFPQIGVVLPSLKEESQIISQVLGLASGISYYLGFATPGWLRRAWQEPELRAFLARAARLPRLPDTLSIIKELEAGAVSSVGAPNARIGLWDEETQTLRFYDGERVVEASPHQLETPDGRSLLLQKPIFTDNFARDYPLATVSVANDVRDFTALLSAPITAGETWLGVLTVYSSRAPIFADDDLELVQLLAEQAAVILESRALIDEATRVQAREEATRLKDDFLSAAAHDLKTPLTTLMGQAQLLERKAQRNPEAPADLAGIQRIVQEAKRLKDLVLELLDAARVEQGKLLGPREPVDLRALAQESVNRPRTSPHALVVEALERVDGSYDRIRIQQLLENLIENAIKYSPEGEEIRVKVWQEENNARLSVTDRGIGIPPHDLSNIFHRFYRGQNVNDRQFAGMGLGLFICRGIVEQHGGRIWAESTLLQGSTFHVTLPLISTERSQ
ncbi:MAG: GAF domain-containing protein [Ardenticatenales bacterium]|nr:GAF domain-containing protein [Ardenticatenales bacterium]